LNKLFKIPLICHYGDHCEININTRRNCTCCRLGKCFSNGMSADMFRSSRTNQIKNKLILERLSKHEQVCFLLRIYLIIQNFFFY
jgi:hypothetical protein